MNPLWSTRELRDDRGDPARDPRRLDGRDQAELSLAGSPARPVPAHRRRDQRHPALARVLAHLRSRPSRRPRLDHRQARPDRQDVALLHRQAEPGSIVFLGEVEGTFCLPEPLPAKSLFISAGSGITPIMSMLRELDRRDGLDDVVHVHCARTKEDFIFASMMRDSPSVIPATSCTRT